MNTGVDFLIQPRETLPLIL